MLSRLLSKDRSALLNDDVIAMLEVLFVGKGDGISSLSGF